MAPDDQLSRSRADPPADRGGSGADSPPMISPLETELIVRAESAADGGALLHRAPRRVPWFRARVRARRCRGDGRSGRRAHSGACSGSGPMAITRPGMPCSTGNRRTSRSGSGSDADGASVPVRSFSPVGRGVACPFPCDHDGRVPLPVHLAGPTCQYRPQDPPVRPPLPGLDQRRRPPSPQLHAPQHRDRHRLARVAARRQDAGGGDRVLHGQVDADPAHRRHRVRGVTDEQQRPARASGAAGSPARQQPHVVP